MKKKKLFKGDKDNTSKGKQEGKDKKVNYAKTAKENK